MLTSANINIFTMEMLTQILVVMGNLTVIMLYVAPYKDIMDIYYTKKYDKFPYLILIASIVNCFFWLLYGILTSQIGLIIGNGIGLTLNIVYWLVYVYCLEISRNKKLILSLGTLIALPLAFNIWLFQNVPRDITGYCGLCCSLVLSASPMQNLAKAISEKDNSYIPIRIVSIVLLTSLSWSAFGFIIHDLIILIPNLWGICTSIFQMYFFLILMNEKKVIKDDTEDDIKTGYLKDSNEQDAENNDFETAKII